MTNHPIVSSKLYRPMRNESVGRLWKKTEPLVESNEALRQSVLNLIRRVNKLERQAGNVLSGLHPFKIYQLPPQYRQTDDPAGPNFSDLTDWLKWRVRAGAVTLISLDGTAPTAQPDPLINVGGTDAVVNPDIETYLDNPVATDILVPAGAQAFYLWVTVSLDPTTGLASAQLYYGTSPAQAAPQADNWPSFPQPDAFHQLIGYMDTLTFQSDRQATVRQIARADMVFIETNLYGICDSQGNSLGNAIVMGGLPRE